MPSTVESYLNQSCDFPFCKGCGHSHVLRKLNEALVALQIDPADLCLVTDIGCIGLADALFALPHTVHTTHGRSTAFATGLAMADSVLGASKLKVVVLIGDGGAMIGILHLISAALLNVDMTVLLCNNFLFGMTGGQNSAFSPIGFKTPTTPAGNMIPPLDICTVVSSAHGGFVARAMATDHTLSDTIGDAIRHPGFSLLEIVELCPEHGVSRNPLAAKNLRETMDEQGHSPGQLQQEASREPFGDAYRSRFPVPPRDEQTRGTNGIGKEFESSLSRQEGIIIAGSAGERIQSSAHLLCRAAALSGLYSTQKNDNPVTQGSGFSVSEVNLSPTPIHYTAIERPSAVIVLSNDGLKELTVRGIPGALTAETLMVVDESIRLPETEATVYRSPFRRMHGGKKGTVAAIEEYIRLARPFPLQAWERAVSTARGSGSLTLPASSQVSS